MDNNQYYMNKEHGNLVTYAELWQDAEENGYDDITDPCSVEYLNWALHYCIYVDRYAQTEA